MTWKKEPLLETGLEEINEAVAKLHGTHRTGRGRDTT